MSKARPIPLAVIVFSLLVAGGLLFAAVQSLSSVYQTQAGTVDSPEIHAAAAAGDVGAIQALAKAGADVDLPLETARRVEAGYTPLMSALQAGHRGAADALIAAGADVNKRSQADQTALIIAAGWTTPDAVNMLLEKGARVDARNRDNWTALMMAAGRGGPETLRALLAAGARVDERNKWGQTALSLAAYSGDAAKIGALIDAGAGVNETDNEGKTALSILAGGAADLGGMQRLLAAGANPNIADAAGVTPLMRAAERGEAEKIQLLLAAKADAAIKDRDGRTAADWARSRDDDAGRAIAAILGGS